jgi:type II secretory pathway pseudopilin PulG
MDNPINYKNIFPIMDKKKTKIIVVTIILLLLTTTAGYFLFFNNDGEEELESNSEQTSEERETIDVEQGNLFKLESENKSFYLPKGWTSKKSTDDNFFETYLLEGDDLTLSLEFLPVEDGSQWSKQDNIEYSTSTSRLYKEDGVYKAIFNISQTRINEDFENNTRTEQDYGLFLTIKKNNEPIETLTTEEYSYIKYILDSYDQLNSY